jgi:DNA-binding HxlR family transcriptional regulator
MPSAPGAPPAPAHSGCQVTELFTLLGQPHMLDILHAFREVDSAPLRFNELQSRLRLSPKTLALRLRTLVEAGFLARTAYNQIPPKVEYQPTSKTDELGAIFQVLEGWSERHTMKAVATVATVGRSTA